MNILKRWYGSPASEDWDERGRSEMKGHRILGDEKRGERSVMWIIGADTEERGVRLERMAIEACWEGAGRRNKARDTRGAGPAKCRYTYIVVY